MGESQRLCLIGPYAGQLITLNDEMASTALADGWARDIVHMPFTSDDAKPSTPMWQWPESLKAWLREAWFNVVPDPPDPEPPFSTAVENIANQMDAIVKVAAADFPNFTVGTVVRFEDTGSPVLDEPTVSFNVISVNTVGKTFRINADLASAPSPVTTGTIFIVPVAPPSLLF